MSYKSYSKKGDVILARIQVIKGRIGEEKPIKEIANSFSMHRNSVRNIIPLYDSLAPPWFREKIISGDHFSLDEIQSSCQFLIPKSRRPKSHPRQVPSEREQKILEDFTVVKIGAKRLYTLLSRKKELGTLTLGSIRGVYRRHNLRVQKVRTRNKETRSLYDYQTVGAFSHLHYDTKELADQKSLPVPVYENLKHNEHLPLYEWNIIDVASRVRFIAYSRGKTSTFGLEFLSLVLSHIRSCGILSSEQGGYPIQIHTDNGSEFFSGSISKQAEWDTFLGIFDASIDSYNPNWDIRKNIIERSHRSDDEEFLISFGDRWKTKEDFMIQAREYSDYWNNNRSHSGHGIEGRTPREQLGKRGLPKGQVQRLLDFPTLHLDESAYMLHEHRQYFKIQQKLQELPIQHKPEKLTERKNNPLRGDDRKGIIDFLTTYPERDLQEYAQNVLIYYQNGKV